MWDEYASSYTQIIEKHTAPSHYENVESIDLFKNKKNFLEIGCASGLFLQKVLDSHKFDQVDAWDISEEFIEQAKKKSYKQ